LDPRFTLAGLIVGACVGFSGVGGGSLMTPLLIILFGMNPLVAVGTDLLYSVPTKIVGAFVHARQRTIDWDLVHLLAVGGVPGVLTTLAVISGLRRIFDVHVLELWTRHAVGVAIIGSALVIFVLPFLRRLAPQTLEDPTTRERVLLIGAAVGITVTLTSIGSGAFTLPLLLVLLSAFDARKLVGSDVAFGAILIPFAAIGHWSMGDVNLGVCASLLVGSIPGVILGSRLTRVIPQAWLRPALAGVLVIAGSRLV
jgi:hypothetical protein